MEILISFIWYKIPDILHPFFPLNWKSKKWEKELYVLNLEQIDFIYQSAKFFHIYISMSGNKTFN